MSRKGKQSSVDTVVVLIAGVVGSFGLQTTPMNLRTSLPHCSLRLGLCCARCRLRLGLKYG